jgi:NAD(P)-dependent dehydrogenase (short-subunit alcohol dehydrogenase family)
MEPLADPFADRVAVVTGGAGGIGMAMARAFAARGARLVLADIDEEALALAEKELRDAGASVLGVPTDVTRRESVQALADAAFSRCGGVHLLCNNAGIAVLGPMVDATPADWELSFAINFWGVVHGVQAFVPRMLEQGQGGHVVNTASMAGLVGMSWLGVYCASKFAVVGLSESLARELEPRGIGVSVLCPMIVATNINENSRRMVSTQARGPTAMVVPPQQEMRGGVIAPEEVAQRVVRAIEERRLYVLTHPEQRAILQRRAARLDAEFAPERWNPDA